MEADKIFYFLGCPFCGKTVWADKVKPSTLENFDISWEVLQAREQLAGPGRPKRGKRTTEYKGGFPLIAEKCLTITEMLADPKWRSLALGIVRRIETIHSAYMTAGLIKKPDEEKGEVHNG